MSLEEQGAAELDAAEELFASAIELPPEFRSAYLDAACPDDPALRLRVMRLLRADHAVGTADLPAPTLWLPPDTHTAGEMVAGHYRLVRLIGTGGLGVVWQAEQLAPVHRQVALKFIRHDFDGRHVALRFALERRALALMDHPGIATIYDAGVERDGRPYFAMELVAGEPITTGCDLARMPIEARVSLLSDVCRAVHHAHQKGIVHRDLKPSNILVVEIDGKLVAKVIDFGIAKTVTPDGAPSAAATAITRVGQFVGTPSYMAPEQLAGAGGADVRSDIYALGVVLHELLAGCLPHDRSSGSAGSPPRAVPAPSPAPARRPSSSARRLSSQEITRIAEQRNETPRSLRRRLRGELDWIVGKAMAEEPQLRYASANELADDLLRWRRHEPIAAGPLGSGYRLRKFAQRHTAATVAGALLAISVALGFAGTAVGLLRARAAEQEQRDLRQSAELATRAEAAQRQTAIGAARLAALNSYKAQIAAIGAAIAGCDLTTARRLLAATDPALRGWEWRHLALLSDQSDLVLDLGGEVPSAVAFNPDASEVLVGSLDGTLRSFDVATGTPRSTANLGPDRLLTLDVAPSGDRVIASLYSKTNSAIVEYRLLEWPGAKIVAGGFGRTTNRAFASDGAHVVVTELHAPVATLLDSTTGGIARTIELPGDVHSMFADFGLDPLTLGYRSPTHGLAGIVDLADGSIRQWNVPSNPNGFFDVRSGVYVGGDGNGDALVIQHADPDVRSLMRRRSPRGELRNVHVSRDGHLLVASSTLDGSVQIHDLAGDRPVALLHGHLSTIVAVDMSRDGRRLATASEDGTVRLWRIPPAPTQFIAPLTDPSGRLGAAITRDGGRVASGGWGTVQLWRSDTGALLWSADLGSLYVEGLAFSPTEDRLAIAETDGRVVVLATADGTVRRTLPSVAAGHTGLAWDPLDRWVVVAGADGTLRRIVEATAVEAPSVRLFDGPVTALALSSDGMLYAAGAGAPIMARDNWGEIIKAAPAEPQVVIGRLADGAILARCTLALGPSSLCFGPNNDRLFVGGNDGSVLSFDLRRHDESAASGEDGSWAISEQLAIQCLPRTDLTTGRAPAATPQISWHQVSSISCTADGTRLLVGHRNGALSVVMTMEDGLLLTLQTDWSVHATSIAEAGGGLVVASRTPLMVFETALPSPPLAEIRQRVALAKRLVDPIVVSDHILDRVLRRIELEIADPTVRAEARRYANARGEYHALMISQAIERARDAAAGRDQHQAALDWIEHVEATQQVLPSPVPRSFDLLRATLHLRLGRAEVAVELLEPLITLADGADAMPDLAIPAVLAMARLHQGHLDDAERLVAAIKKRLEAGDPLRGEARWYVPEAARAIEGRRAVKDG